MRGVQIPAAMRSIISFLRRTKHRFTLSPPLGWVRFGSLSRVHPISDEFGFDRGQPVDRFYIENFLTERAADIKGRVLEFSSSRYTRTFGGGQVTQSDVMDLDNENHQATIIGDLLEASLIPSNSFDCVICTQMLGLFYDVKAAVEALHRILKPDGVLLLTVGGISRLGRYDVDTFGSYWRFTSHSVRRLLEEHFAAANVKVETWGNVYAAVAFLEGVAVEELHLNKLRHRDPYYQVVIAARAAKGELFASREVRRTPECSSQSAAIHSTVRP